MAGGDAFPGGTPPLDITNLWVPAGGMGNGNSAQSLLTALTQIKAAIQEGTFTPTLLLGGTPVTSYTAQIGYWSKIGNRVFFQLVITVNVKGAGVGNLQIGGLPFATSAATLSHSVVAIRMFGGLGLTTESITGITLISATLLSLFKFLNGSAAPLTDANVANGLELFVTGNYLAA